jgi:hypothetical protein
MELPKAIKLLLAGTALFFILDILLVFFVLNDGNLFPVVTPLVIEDIKPYKGKPRFSVVSGNFTKERSCLFEKVNWYYTTGGKFNDRVRVISYLEDPAEVRPATEEAKDNRKLEHFERLIINLSEDDIRNNSYGETVHKCYGASLWNTVSYFYEKF